MSAKKVGAPKGSGSKYTDEIADQIVDSLSEGITLSHVCKLMKIERRSVYNWIGQFPEFASRFARARELGEDAIADEALRIANNPVIGVIETIKSDGSVETRREDMLGHRKLQIDTRLKLLAKWNPKKWGDRITHAGDASAPVALQLNGSDTDG